MTNAQINQELALKALNENKLNAYEAAFVNKIKDWDKKQLRDLSKAQYKLLERIASIS